MADSLNARVTLSITVNKVKDLDIRDITEKITTNWEQSFTSGVGSGKADLHFADTRSLNADTSENLDLAGVLADAFGATITAVKLKVLAIRNNSASQTLTVGGATNVPLFADISDKIPVEPSSFKLLLCDPIGITVTATTGDLITVANGAGSAASYDIIMIAATAAS